MRNFRLLLAACALVALGSIWIGPAALAAGDDGPSTHTTTMRADVNVFDPTLTDLNLNVSHVHTVTRNPGAPTSVTDQTMLNLFIPSASASACVLLAPGQFAVDPALHSAALHVAIDSTTPTCYGPGSLLPPTTLDVTWAATGPIEIFRNISHGSCSTSSTDTVSTDTGNNAVATVSISPEFGAPFTVNPSGIGSNDTRSQTTGVADPACNGPGVPGGIGPFPGFHPTGKYEFGSSQADVFGFSPDPTLPSVGLTVFQNISISNPRGGPSSSSIQMTLGLSINNPDPTGVSGFGCYVIDPSTFAISTATSSASLHVVLNAQPSCNGLTSTLPLPLTVDATWTGALLVQQGTAKLTCLDYSAQSNYTSEGMGIANTSVTVSALPTSFTSQGDLFANDSKIQAKGTAQLPCTSRG